MRRDRTMDEVFEQFLPSASQEQIEGARWRILDRVRANTSTGREALDGTFTLNRGDYHILLALVGGERHGYAIMSDVEEITEGATKFGPGTFYTSISRLLTAGLIEETQKRPDPRLNDEPRQYYRLTGIGRKVLASASERLAEQLFQVRAQQLVRSL